MSARIITTSIAQWQTASEESWPDENADAARPPLPSLRLRGAAARPLGIQLPTHALTQGRRFTAAGPTPPNPSGSADDVPDEARPVDLTSEVEAVLQDEPALATLDVEQRARLAANIAFVLAEVVRRLAEGG